MSKRGYLGLSIVVSLLLHGLGLAVSPSLPVLKAPPPPTDILDKFQVRLVDSQVVPVALEPDFGDQPLVSRPGTVEDMMNREKKSLTPDDTLLKRTADVPDVADRVGSDTVAREHDLEADEDLMQEVDGKIVEISESAVRPEVQIARRLVAPSSNRIVGEDELPTLRSGPDDLREVALLIDPLPVRKVSGPVGPPEPATSGQTTAEQETPEEPEVSDEPPVEEMIARLQVDEELRKERTHEALDDVVSMKLDTYVPPGNGQGFFRLRIVPKEGGEIEPLPKDVTFIIDASSSISQRKLDSTVAGVQESLKMLRPKDRFNVVIFRDNPTKYQPSLVPATEANIAGASEFLEGLEARGETDVYSAIRPVVLSEPRTGVPNIILVMTDGRPTTGIRDAREIINSLTTENSRRNSVFAFGGGRSVNRYMLDLLAYRNKGESRITPRLEKMSDELPIFFSKLEDPILVDCRADYGRIDEDNVFPREIPDFYKGHAVTVYGRFDPKKQKEFAMRLDGDAGERQKEVVFKADMADAQTGDEDIARNWAFSRIYYLIGEMTRVGEKPELLNEIRELSRKYDIQTSYDQ